MIRYDGINMIALIKDEERYIFMYDDSSLDELLRTFGKLASNPELNFTWYDAAVLSQKVRREPQYMDGLSSLFPNQGGV